MTNSKRLTRKDEGDVTTKGDVSSSKQARSKKNVLFFCLVKSDS